MFNSLLLLQLKLKLKWLLIKLDHSQRKLPANLLYNEVVKIVFFPTSALFLLLFPHYVYIWWDWIWDLKRWFLCVFCRSHWSLHWEPLWSVNLRKYNEVGESFFFYFFFRCLSTLISTELRVNHSPNFWFDVNIVSFETLHFRAFRF